MRDVRAAHTRRDAYPNVLNRLKWRPATKLNFDRGKTMPLTKIALCAAIVGATLCVPIAAQAQAPRYYIGASFGRMDTNINDASFAATRISVKDRDNAWKLYGGGNFNRHIGVEAG